MSQKNDRSDRISEYRKVAELSGSSSDITAEEVQRRIIKEARLDVRLNGRRFVSLMCLHEFTEELALGFLFNEGYIDSLEEVKSMEVKASGLLADVELSSVPGTEEVERKVTTTSAKGLTFLNSRKEKTRVVLEDSLRVPMAEIWRLAREFGESSKIKREIGGVHSALFHHPQLSLFYEDVGRHNCIDKIAGALLKRGALDWATEAIIFSSGRVSTEMISKLLRLRLPIYVSLTTPTSSVVDLAREHNMTLLGYVKDRSAVLYSGRQRIEI
jgi:FdhD protein